MKKTKRLSPSERYPEALANAQELMDGTDLEPTSALKQAASDVGISEGAELKTFVEWGHKQWGI